MAKAHKKADIDLASPFVTLPKVFYISLRAKSPDDSHTIKLGKLRSGMDYDAILL